MASFRRVQLRWIALAGLLATLFVPGLLRSTPVTATPAVNVGLVSFSQWTEQLGTTTLVHLVGEVANNDAIAATLIQVHFNLIPAPVGYGYGYGSPLGPETVNVWEMGTNVLGPTEVSPFQDVFPAPPNYDHAEFTSITDAVSSTPPDHNFSFISKTCAINDANHICGTVTNNNNSSVDNVRVLFTFYKGITTAGKLQTVDTDALPLNNNPTSTLQAHLGAVFELDRSSNAPTYASYVLLAESATTAPAAPRNVTATAGNSSANVSWSAPTTDGGRPITQYKVTSSQGQTATVTGNPPPTSATVTGLTNGSSYTFTVTATNALDDSFPSQPSNAVIPATVPDAPTNVVATAGNQSATVQWRAPFDEGRTITQYTVTSSPGGVTATVTGNPPSTSATVTGLTNGTTYTFTVTATNAIGTGPASAPSNAVTPTGPPPTPPTPTQTPGPVTSDNATPGAGYATVTWTPPISSGSSAITSYVVTVHSTTPANGNTVTAGGSATSAIVAGLPSGTYTFTVKAVNTQGAGPDSTPTPPITVTAGGQYFPLPPARIVDTRYGTGAPQAPVGPGGSLNVTIINQGGVPASGVSAVVINVTVTNTTAPSYLTIYPTGTLKPLASNLNWVAGQTVPNLVVVKLGTAGQVTIFNAAGNTDVIFDVAGWISTPETVSGTSGLLRPLVPARLMDTRSGLGGSGKLSGNQSVDLQVSGTSVPASASAVVLNVTVTNPTAGSYLTVFPAGALQPVVSNLNFVAGQTVANRVMVKLGVGAAAGKIRIYNAYGNVDVIVDVNGWFTDGSDPNAIHGEFTGQAPVRILDSRPSGGGSGPFSPQETRTLQVAGNGSVPANATGAILNVTATDTTAGGYLVVYPSGAAQPPSSDVNFVANQTVPNLVVVKLGADGKIAIYNSAGFTDVVVDVFGWYN